MIVNAESRLMGALAGEDFELEPGSGGEMEPGPGSTRAAIKRREQDIDNMRAIK